MTNRAADPSSQQESAESPARKKAKDALLDALHVVRARALVGAETVLRSAAAHRRASAVARRHRRVLLPRRLLLVEGHSRRLHVRLRRRSAAAVLQEPRAEFGIADDERVVTVAVGCTDVGRYLLEAANDASTSLRKSFPSLRIELVCGMSIPPEELAANAHEGVRRRRS
jgi:hypothetical protein